MEKFTVILVENESPKNIILCHVTAKDVCQAGYEAAESIYRDSRSAGWAEEDLADDPFCFDDFTVHYVFPGHLESLPGE